MLARNSSQLEHRHLRLAEHRQQFGIGIDKPLVGRISQVLDFDVVPQLLSVLKTRHLFDFNHRVNELLGFNWSLTPVTLTLSA